VPTPPDDILFNKGAIIERCIRRVAEEYAACPELDKYTHVDAMTLNIERACQAAIDMAMHLVASRHLGIPQSSGDAFSILERNGLLPPDIARSMRAMAGFRNVAVHQYTDLDIGTLHWIARHAPTDWSAFCAELGVHISP